MNFHLDLHLHSETAEGDNSIANLFAKKFSSVYTDLDLSSTNFNFEFADSFNNIVFTERDFELAICKLDQFSSPSPDNIHPSLMINFDTLFKP